VTYRDRRAAGAVLAERLAQYAGRDDVVVLGLVRGGLPVAAEVAHRLDVPLDALMVRKLGVPWAPEVAFGAVGPHGVRVLNQEIVSRLPPAAVSAVVHAESAELARREHRYRAARPPLDLTGRVALLVDDGLATGATMRAAIAAVAGQWPRRVIAAVPVAPRETKAAFSRDGIDLVCVVAPHPFLAVGSWYDDFAAVSDEEVVRLLRR
jgi:predicted phosphoribosyltransferase